MAQPSQRNWQIGGLSFAMEQLAGEVGIGHSDQDLLGAWLSYCITEAKSCLENF